MYHNKQMHAFFTEQLKTVIDINISVGKAPPRGSSDFVDLETAKENQLDRFKEEYKELVDSTDAVQHADALCDIFVTLGGYIYLLNQLYRTPTGVDDSVTPIDAYLMSADEMASRVKDDLTYAYAVMAQVCKSIIMMVEVDCLGYLKTINENNLSKFPKTLAECEESISWYQQNTS